MGVAQLHKYVESVVHVLRASSRQLLPLSPTMTNHLCSLSATMSTHVTPFLHHFLVFFFVLVLLCVYYIFSLLLLIISVNYHSTRE